MCDVNTRAGGLHPGLRFGNVGTAFTTDLIAAIAGHISDWFFAGLRAHAARRPGLGSLIAGIDYYFDLCRRDPATLRALHTVLAGALNKPQVRDAVAKLNRDSVKAIEADIRAGIANGEIRRGIDAHTASVLLLASVRGIVAQWLVDPEQVDLESLRRDFVAALKRTHAP